MQQRGCTAPFRATIRFTHINSREGIAVEFWMTLWKVVFIVSVGAFSIMAVWVTIGGARDIKRLLTTLKGDNKEDTLPKE